MIELTKIQRNVLANLPEDRYLNTGKIYPEASVSAVAGALRVLEHHGLVESTYQKKSGALVWRKK